MDFNILTLGCKVNQYESQAMREDLLKNGYFLMDKFGPEYVFNKKALFKSISGDETGIDGWVDNKFYLYKNR